ncbi:MAG: hypothetical protein KJO19_06270 [Woeseia sp.]|nr:hypothetical protein [Woeseia sp.]
MDAAARAINKSTATRHAVNATRAADAGRLSWRRPGLRLYVILLVAFANGACVTQTVPRHDNSTLRNAIDNAVPGTWQDAFAATETRSPLTVTPELAAFVRSTVERNAPARTRLLMLVEALFEPDGVGLSYDAAATHTAAEAFHRGTANCLGFSNLLVAIAREAGVRAEFELVAQEPRWQKVGDMLVASLHMRVTSRTGGHTLTFDFYPRPLDTDFTTRRVSDEEALAHHLNNLAVRAMQEGDGAKAYALLMESMEVDSQVAFIWSNLGLLLSRHGMEQFAEAAFIEALTISPRGLSALSNLQQLYTRQQRHEEARQLEVRLREHRERNPYYHALQGEKALDQGFFSDAVRHYKMAIRLKDDVADFYIGLSESYAGLGDSEAASRAANRAWATGKAKLSEMR